MYVKVRTMDGSQTAVLTISKLTSVSEFRGLVQDKFDVPSERQRLFYRGKQMEDGHTMFDYNVNINDVIQLMIKPVLTEITNHKETKEKIEKLSEKNKENTSDNTQEEVLDEPNSTKLSLYYNVGDLVDALSLYDGAWWEAKITKIVPTKTDKKCSLSDDGFLYYVKYESYADLPEEQLKLECIRPRARKKASFSSLKMGHMVMVNYNVENPQERGFWYDCEVTKVINTRSSKTLIGTIFAINRNAIEDCHVHLVNEIFKIEKCVPISERLSSNEAVPAQRVNGAICSTCKDNPKRKCKDCGCYECGGKENPGKQLMCDECDQPFHIYCLDPPLEAIPDVEEWFCPLCKNDDNEIVKAGEKLKNSKKKSKMASAKSNSSRDWGKGFACASRQRICDIVPQNHFGPVPGVEVGSLWKYRLQVSEAGIHRPHVAGIHGREQEGAYSIVLAGGYEDDEDRGEEFTYTGSGGRDLSGNKRTAEQSCDQTLTRMNKALALNCNVKINKEGAEAKNWQGGKPVRVVRNWKGHKHSDYAPEEGNRYDGIYKIVKYWQASGKSGFKVWRYLLRRDDPVPAPWSKEGKKRTKELGLTLKFPDGYEDAMKEKEKEQSFIASNSDDSESEEPKKRGRKRKSMAKESTKSPAAKKLKTSSYQIEKELLEFIKNDEANSKIWKQCQESTDEGKAKFVAAVEDSFLCVCCQILVNNPVSTDCGHNVCKSCLQRSFKAEVYKCPSCRHDLGKENPLNVNEHLRLALNILFPGYERGR